MDKTLHSTTPGWPMRKIIISPAADDPGVGQTSALFPHVTELQMWHLSSHTYSLGWLYRFRDPKMEARYRAYINRWSIYNTQLAVLRFGSLPVPTPRKKRLQMPIFF